MRKSFRTRCDVHGCEVSGLFCYSWFSISILSGVLDTRTGTLVFLDLVVFDVPMAALLDSAETLALCPSPVESRGVGFWLVSNAVRVGQCEGEGTGLLRAEHLHAPQATQKEQCAAEHIKAISCWKLSFVCSTKRDAHIKVSNNIERVIITGTHGRKPLVAAFVYVTSIEASASIPFRRFRMDRFLVVIRFLRLQTSAGGTTSVGGTFPGHCAANGS